MKYFLLGFIVAFILCCLFSCGDPYANPETSKALSEKEQTEEMKKQNILLEQQNQYLKRIAEALEAKNK